MKTKHKAGELDIRIGENLRAIRLAHGMTQQKLAEQVGVTFQQIQKYERGTNRISASTLFEIANVFGEPLICFYFKLEHKPDNPPETSDTLRAFAAKSRKEAALIKSVLALPPKWLKIVKAIVREASE